MLLRHITIGLVLVAVLGGLAQAPATAHGDWDGDVDLDDFLLFFGCMGGPHATAPPPSCDPGDSTNGDFDADGDMDMEDFAAFQVAFTGS